MTTAAPVAGNTTNAGGSIPDPIGVNAAAHTVHPASSCSESGSAGTGPFVAGVGDPSFVEPALVSAAESTAWEWLCHKGTETYTATASSASTRPQRTSAAASGKGTRGMTAGRNRDAFFTDAPHMRRAALQVYPQDRVWPPLTPAAGGNAEPTSGRWTP
ncbi:hypothetical protein BH11PLA1_BH11PLA1_02830 [soil metagenome]